MRSSGLIALLLVQSLCNLGPVEGYNLQAMTEWVTRVSEDQVNQRSLGLSLYRVSSAALQGVSQVGPGTFVLQLRFAVRETVCPRGYERVLDRCTFRHHYVASEATCSSVVKVASGSVTQLQALSCVQTSAPAAAAAVVLGSDSLSISASSSEEMRFLRRRFLR